MESNAMFPGIRTGMLSLETPQNAQNPQNSIQFNQSQIASYANNPSDHQHHGQTIKQPAAYQYVPPLSDEDDPGSASGSGFNPDDTNSDDKRKFSPWHRMKWTDTMVRLLIMAVFYIGDEAGAEPADPSKKNAAGGALQKKGKWKSVSRAMIEKGFCVSPQQCEDKFNDLNKRYKRVNDVLGKGTACRVVENQNLLETMDLPSKIKEEIRKLLNSKHLFFREMCAYHNSCGHLNADQTHQANNPHQPQRRQEQTHCQNNVRTNGEEPKMAGIVKSDEEEGDDEDSEDDPQNGVDDEDEEDGETVSQPQNGGLDKPSCKKPRKGAVFQAPAVSRMLVNQLGAEANNVIRDPTKSVWEKKQWIRTRIMRLGEQQVGFESEALELEKQKLKWMRFSGKKERELERAKLENERKKLENERMVLFIRQKEFELLEIHHNDQRRQQ